MIRTMKILVINSGSSSIKYQLIQMPQEEVLASGQAERIGLEGSRIHCKAGKTERKRELRIANHEQGIEVAEKIFPQASQVAVFDTAFHQSIPEEAYRYAIPENFYVENQIRVYGFHGTSHKYVSQKAVEHLGQAESKIITIHLGNGCSITAVQNGKSREHSLGFGPMNGLIMGTRSGDIDQSVIFYMILELGYSADAVKKILQEESGMYGLTGFSDLREIEEAAEKGDRDCRLALLMNAYRVKKFIGAYAAAMNGLEAIVFTAGIGENSPYMRQLICEDMSYFGLELDVDKNASRGRELREIQKEGSGARILVVPTNEELEIAKQAFELLNGIRS